LNKFCFFETAQPNQELKVWHSRNPVLLIFSGKQPMAELNSGGKKDTDHCIHAAGVVSLPAPPSVVVEPYYAAFPRTTHIDGVMFLENQQKKKKQHLHKKKIILPVTPGIQNYN
jgi:hypothetical protein